jgi:Putative zinc-finger
VNEIPGCLHIRQTLGVYVLGAIDPAERATVDAHLAGCADCREELAGLAGLPALLGRVPFEEAEQIAGPAQDGLPQDDPVDAGAPGVVAVEPLLARVAHQRRVRRWRGLAAAAAAVAVAAGAALGAVGISHSPAPAAAVAWQTARMTDSATHTTVVVKYQGEPWGTRLDAMVSGIPAGTTCQFWVTGPGGQRWSAGSWTVDSTYAETWFPASSSAPIKGVTGFEITTGHTVLASLRT